jgi:hypothetical protein
MIPAAVAIERSGVAIELDHHPDVVFETMPRWIRLLVPNRVSGLTLGPRIFLDHQTYDEVVAGLRPDIVSHELVHAGQWKADGGRFPFKYLSEYLRFRLVGVAHDAAYRSISYEVEAFRAGAESHRSMNTTDPSTTTSSSPDRANPA